MRLIDADKLRKGVIDLPDLYNGFSDTYDKSYILDIVDEQPTIEAEPIRHGHWIFGQTMGHSWMKCSECCVSQGGQTATFTYCPNCGAKMDEEINENETY